MSQNDTNPMFVNMLKRGNPRKRFVPLSQASLPPWAISQPVIVAFPQSQTLPRAASN
jgi:hypothetical protein